MVLMALDHSRDFFGDIRIPPENVATTTTVLFFTRWVTHLCAPTFLLLAGASAWLHGQKLQNRTELSKFLITRGLWLLFLEFTVVRFALLFSLTLGPWFFIVIAAIGSSMVLLGVACWLPDRAVLGLGIAIVCGHNLLDAVSEDCRITRLAVDGTASTRIHPVGEHGRRVSDTSVVRRNGAWVRT